MERQGLQNMSRSYFHRADAVILVHDVGDMGSLLALDGWLQLVYKFCHSRGVLLALWGLETGNTTNPTEPEAMQQFARARGISSSLVCSVCVETIEGLATGFRAVVEEICRLSSHPPPQQTLTSRSQRHSQKSSCCYN